MLNANRKPMPCKGCGKPTRAQYGKCRKCEKLEDEAVAKLPKNEQGPKILRQMFRFP
jgi:hypothetical protein